MKRAKINIIYIFFMLSLLAVQSISVGYTLKFGIYDDYPVVYLDKNGNPAGFYVDIIKEIAKREKWNVKFIYGKWEDLFISLDSGEIDFITAIAETEERKKVYAFNDEAFLQNWGVLVGRAQILDLFTLKAKEIGLVRSDVYAEEFLRIVKSFEIKIQPVYYDTYREVVEALENGEIFAGVISRLSAIYLSPNHKFVSTAIIFKPVNLKLAYLKNSKIAASTAKVIDKYLMKWKKDETSPYWRYLNENLLLKKPFPKWLSYVLWLLLIVAVAATFLVLWEHNFSKRLKVELNRATKELQKKSFELETLNKELEESYEKLEELMSKFFDMLESVAKVSNLEINDEDFMQNLLETAVKFLPPARYGSIFLLDEKGYPHIIAAVGHNKEILKNYTFKDTEFFIVPDRPMIVKDIIAYDKKAMNPEDFKIIKKATKPIKESLVVPIEVKDKIIGTMVIDIPPDERDSFTEFHVKMMENFVRVLKVFLTYREYTEIEKNFHRDIILTLVKALDYYSPYTKGHSERVASTAVRIAKKMGFDTNRIERIYWASILHDIGKIFVPQKIINKPGKLTDEEYELMKLHPIKSFELIKDVKGLEDLAKIVRHHHERWDGKGYPDGLRGEEIPIESRIIAVADAFDAMTSERPYRRAFTIKEAVEEIIKHSGKQFDPEVVRYFMFIIEEELTA